MLNIAIVQARMGSTRLPNKVMYRVNGRTLIEILLHRLSKSQFIHKIILATTDSPKDDVLSSVVKNLGYDVYRGSEQDVLGRYYQAAEKYQADNIVRITGDCPLIDGQLVSDVVQNFLDKKVDYASNISPPTYPDGLDVEIFKFSALEKAFHEAKKTHEREHVTPYIRESGLFAVSNLSYTQDASVHRWTVDEIEDFQVVKNVLEHFSPNVDFGWQDVLKLSQEKPDLFKANQLIGRDEGAKLGSGQKLWKRAKHVIPGGNMLLSKRSEMFLPDQWPSYFSKAKGCKVWDLDGREYIDTSIMGIGTNTLGYGHPQVDAAVHEVVDKGNMSTLNCPEEVYLAEKLVELHPWADMVRLARTGGEANAIAIRIARAASGKDKVAICGYHGWHDWYLAANLGDDKNLSGHLLPGLEPNGVPSNLKGTVFPFNYNNFEELENIVKSNSIGVIKMEVIRNHEPQNNFLHKVRELATANGIVLVFDECTSGFRQTFGGLHKQYDVEPDMAMFGKTLGNGYAITAVIGRREVMQATQTTFMSSTFWTERIGPTAALKTLEVMQETKSWEIITRLGKQVKEGWKDISQKYDVAINVSGLDALATFSFNSLNHLAYKTLLTQEMLTKGYLANTSFYACTEHTEEVIYAYLDALEPVFALIKECEDGRPIAPLLKGPICHAGFKRLN